MSNLAKGNLLKFLWQFSVCRWGVLPWYPPTQMGLFTTLGISCPRKLRPKGMVKSNTCHKRKMQGLPKIPPRQRDCCHPDTSTLPIASCWVFRNFREIEKNTRTASCFLSWATLSSCWNRAHASAALISKASKTARRLGSLMAASTIHAPNFYLNAAAAPSVFFTLILQSIEEFILLIHR